MLLHYVECGDGNRHLHKANCGELHFQLVAGEVWEIELPDDATEDDAIAAVWEEFEPETDEELDTYAELTVFRLCANEYFPPEAEDGEESSGNPKADAFMDECERAGWAVEFEWVDNDPNSIMVVAKREYMAGVSQTYEELHFAWYKNRMENAFYVSGHHDAVAKKISSVAGARPYLIGTPLQPEVKPVSSSRVKREDPVKRIPKEMLPFDIETAYDHEILDACRGRTLVWYNNTAENYEKATVIGRNPIHYKIELGQGGRAILSFVSAEGGFRAVALEDLVQVK